tara:strand:- start:934 stop:1431 length:498 start_codon:yes stop_codon:yes gene_type:complete
MSVFTKKGDCLFPVDNSALKLVSKLKDHESVVCTVKKIRSAEQHRMFFALLQIIFENQERYASKDLLLDAIKIYAGHFEEITFPHNSTIFDKRIAKTMVTFGVKDIELEQIKELKKIWTQIKPKSIAFEKLNHDDFQRFFHCAVEFGIILIGADPLELLNETQTA